MSVSVVEWGAVDGQPVQLWTLDSGTGMRVCATNYGTIITAIVAPDRNGCPVDVALGRSSLQDYVDGTPYFGCTVGRCANRIANGQFSINGTAFQLSRNTGIHCLHGGFKGFDKAVWSGDAGLHDGEPRVTFSYTSRDGEEGFPGTVVASVVYTLTRHRELRIEMSATSDATTVVNMAHHTYWNLSGHGSGCVLDHDLQLVASRYTPVDSSLIPTGDILPVAGTPFDFRELKPIGRDIETLPPSGGGPGGYDHNWCVDGAVGALRPVALLCSPKTGVTMHVSSNQDGVQCYTGNFLDGIQGKDGSVYCKHHGVCIETQAFPDSINNQGRRGWTHVLLQPGQRYSHVVVYSFSAQ
jgi:aldose 1-epimerase